MASNLDRFSKDLERLIKQGDLLSISMIKEVTKGSGFVEQIEKQLGKKDAAEYIKKLPDFKLGYESWHSESLALLKQLLPDRASNFVSLYEKPKGRKDITYGNYVIQDYLQNLHVTLGGEVRVSTAAAVPQFNQQLAILKAAKGRFENSLFEIRQLVQADLFDSEIAGARELHRGKFFRAAGVVAGVVLEKHLRQVCDDRSIKIAKKNPTLNDLGELLKSNGTIDIPQWRHLSLLADIRNLCAHNKQAEPTADQVLDLLAGSEKLIKTVV
jgi:hypothetical protein